MEVQLLPAGLMREEDATVAADVVVTSGCVRELIVELNKRGEALPIGGIVRDLVTTGMRDMLHRPFKIGDVIAAARKRGRGHAYLGLFRITKINEVTLTGVAIQSDRGAKMIVRNWHETLIVREAPPEHLSEPT